jgi:hypothetical protein
MRTRRSTDRLSAVGYSVESVVLHNFQGKLYFRVVRVHEYDDDLSKLQYIPAFPFVSYIVADIRGTRSSGTTVLARNPLGRDAEDAVSLSFEAVAGADGFDVTTSDIPRGDGSAWLCSGEHTKAVNGNGTPIIVLGPNDPHES